MEVECLHENVEARSTQDGDQHYLEATSPNICGDDAPTSFATIIRHNILVEDDITPMKLPLLN